MGTSRFPLRGILTALGFLLILPLVSGLIIAMLAFVVNASAPDPIRTTGLGSLMTGLFLAVLAYTPPALVTGVGMSAFSSRIRTAGGWIGYASIAAVIWVVIATVIITRSVFTTGPLLASIVYIAMMAVCCVPGAVAAAFATLRLRPGPPVYIEPGAVGP